MTSHSELHKRLLTQARQFNAFIDGEITEGQIDDEVLLCTEVFCWSLADLLLNAENPKESFDRVPIAIQARVRSAAQIIKRMKSS